MDFLPWSFIDGVPLTFPPSNQEDQCSRFVCTLVVNHLCILRILGHQTLVQSRILLAGLCIFTSCFGINSDCIVAAICPLVIYFLVIRGSERISGRLMVRVPLEEIHVVLVGP